VTQPDSNERADECKRALVRLADLVNETRKAFGCVAKYTELSVNFGVDDDGVRVIAASGGKVGVQWMSDGRVIDWATHTIEGVRFSAQTNSRPATTEDIAALSRAA
jgi:hypothetical protein